MTWSAKQTAVCAADRLVESGDSALAGMSDMKMVLCEVGCLVGETASLTVDSTGSLDCWMVAS